MSLLFLNQGLKTHLEQNEVSVHYSYLGCRELLRVCSQHGSDCDITHNAKKSNIMIIRSREDSKMLFPVFCLSATVLKVCDEIKYLGYYITNDLCDDQDIYRQRRMLNAQANMIVGKFSMCSASVNSTLFRAFCTPMYVYCPLVAVLQKEQYAETQCSF